MPQTPGVLHRYRQGAATRPAVPRYASSGLRRRTEAFSAEAIVTQVM